MRQIVRLRLPPVAYPDAAAALDRARYVRLIAIRRWAADFRQRVDPLPRLCQTLDTAFAPDQPVAVRRPRYPSASTNEQAMLNAASPVQAGDGLMVERALRATLLSAPGAEFALAPWQGLADLFAAVVLFFRRGKPPGLDPAPLNAVHPWIPVTFSETIP